MHENRLELLDARLAQRLSQLPPIPLRQIAKAVSHFVLQQIPIDDISIVRQGYQMLEINEVGDPELRQQLLATIRILDEHQWSLHDLIEMERAADSEYMRAFERARAANAIYYALSADAWEAATESIYEATAATDQFEAIAEIVSQVLGTSSAR